MDVGLIRLALVRLCSNLEITLGFVIYQGGVLRSRSVLMRGKNMEQLTFSIVELSHHDFKLCPGSVHERFMEPFPYADFSLCKRSCGF